MPSVPLSLYPSYRIERRRRGAETDKGRSTAVASSACLPAPHSQAPPRNLVTGGAWLQRERRGGGESSGGDRRKLHGGCGDPPGGLCRAPKGIPKQVVRSLGWFDVYFVCLIISELSTSDNRERHDTLRWTKREQTPG
ncbi:hypothetical protein EYF80_017196 [Liparis tanakae]|uniref:Uncharacterized protein n=1 Tax=Liparis tanakae TaxID=230148 RepID=A0A4Z2I3E6_9TELE|nr:hypothetical protein EYF80_017196 [Liparis tanakae]